MVVLVCYDIATVDAAGAQRLRRVAAACKNHGARVQYSLFECRIDDATWVKLRASLLRIADPATDSLRFYFLDDASADRCEHHGVRAPPNFRDPLIV